MKLRIAAAAAVGVLLISIFLWPLAESPEPFGPVRFGNLDFGGAVILLAVAVLVGFIGYFVSWPYGREIGILAVPCGLAIWALRTGNMASIVQQNLGVDQRLALLNDLRWEPLFWLVIVAAGFAGVLLAQMIRPSARAGATGDKTRPKANTYLYAVIAIAASVGIAYLCLGKLAQGIEMTNGKIDVVMAQPAIGQIVFGVLFAFGIAGFLVKNFLDANYIWPIIAAALVTPFTIIIYVKQDVVEHLASTWPAVFFSSTITSILPVQMVAFGTIGAIAGYWMGIRYDFWRKHEI